MLAPRWLPGEFPARVLLDQEDAGLAVLDDLGRELARFTGPVAAAARRRLGATGPADPAGERLLDRALAHAPGLARALTAAGAEGAGTEGAGAAAQALRRGGWRQLFVELTARCNERCAHCYVAAAPERTEALDRATAEAVVDDAAALGFEVVQLTGGEALLCPFVGDLAARARAAGVPVVEVYTNATLLDDGLVARFARDRVALAVSLYAAEPAAHDRVTRLPGSHARTVDAVRRALAAGLSVRVGVVAARPEDEPHALAAAALARDLGVPPESVGLDVARAVGRGRFAGRAVPADPDPRARPRGPGHASPVRLGPAPGRNTAALPPVETSAGAEGPAGGARTGAHGGACDAGAAERGGKAAVLADGRVVPCIFSRALTLGRVGPDGGLRAALERPAVRLVEGDEAQGLAGALARANAALACGSCRVTGALLRPCGAEAAAALARDGPRAAGAPARGDA